ncbi:NYN domain-containing protein [Glycomyces buryatensis]|uniref:NYN domain-containing protein n=1 Tax=Glycomyces buryatensis TaxID=2570927 RepID=A0A4S8QBF5_9ACTN|nr:NYN domain-containing protein [Glycomyces buryatensis]THV40232.1 NYN domain-containing protein [Glycomyces buryatensis]
MQENTVRSGAAKTRRGRLPAWWSGWPRWSGYAAAVWSLAYGALGAYWAFGGAGFPFGRGNDQEAEYSILVDADVVTAAPVIALLGLLGAAVGVMMAKAVGRGFVRAAVMVFAWAAAATLAVVVTDLRLLMLITRILVAPVFAFTGVPGGGSVADFFPWPRLHLLILLGGGLLWGLAALSYQRRTGQACANCGRDGTVAWWSTPPNALRWGRWAVAVAAGVPAIYALSRLAMAAGSRVGIPQAFYDEMEGSGVIVGDLLMASMAIGGMVLTVGLVRPWGEVFPRWIWFAAGRRVPPSLALIPASIITVFITAAGVSEARSLLLHGIDTQQWGITGPTMLWPLWGPALGAATYAYYLRRRTPCRHCGQGEHASSLLNAANE